MRKGPLAAMAALLVLSLALLIGAHLAVNSRRDQVDWDVTVLEGDLSAAQGVTAAIRLQDREGNLFWDTALTMGTRRIRTLPFSRSLLRMFPSRFRGGLWTPSRRIPP